MSSFDYFIAIVLIISLAIGYHKGLMKQLGFFCAIFVAVVMSRLFTSPLSRYLLDNGYLKSDSDSIGLLNNEYIASILTGVGIFVVSFIGVLIVVRCLRMAIASIRLTALDRLGGMLFTSFMSLLAISLVLNVCQLFKKDGPIVKMDGVGGGKVAEWVLKIAPVTFGTASLWMHTLDQSDDAGKTVASIHDEQ